MRIAHQLRVSLHTERLRGQELGLAGVEKGREPVAASHRTCGGGLDLAKDEIGCQLAPLALVGGDPNRVRPLALSTRTKVRFVAIFSTVKPGEPGGTSSTR